MGKLMLVTDGFAGVEFPLSPGANTVGRNPGNTIEISHDSVSGSHGVLEEDPGGWLVVRDNDSTNGTYYNGEMVSEAYVTAGETFRLGHVDVKYVANQPSTVAETPSAPTGAPIPPAEPTASPTKRSGKACKKHPDNDLAYACTGCKQKFCLQCVNQVEINGKTKKFCPTCRTKCISLEKFKEQRKAQQDRENRSFWKCVPELLKYPVTRQGLPLLLMGSFLYLVLDFAAMFSLKIAIAAAGYLFAYMQKIIIATANGEEDLPGWPDFSDWFTDILRPCFMMVWTFAISFGPAVLYMIHHATSASDMNMGVLFPLYAWGFLYFPMALLAVAMADSFMAVNPFVVLPSITRLSGQYIVVCSLFFAMVAIRYISERLLSLHLEIMILPSVITSVLALYFLVVEMRMLGTMYYLNRRRLGWFRSER
jgi:pSer/pThr/pTyr-binding forkhead associated (FHA) protein